MQLKPLGDRVLVKPVKEEEVTASGIVLPDTVDKEKKAEGEVVAIGEGDKVKKLGLKNGDVVLYGKYGGDEVEIDGEEHKILSHDDVLGVFIK